jgi:alkanesulfonate monooxygenase SsuD/methylene tetrahydromethanopterin reductase-like flavin-dependent oxidoreductase (luciferase family)
MKLTLFINPEHPPTDPLEQRFAEHLEQVRVAREAGFDGVAIGHHLSHGPAVWFPPFETLARLAAEAKGMTIGTCMLLLPLFHPFHIAQQAALLDVLSGGRLILGVAPGWQEDEYRAHGMSGISSGPLPSTGSASGVDRGGGPGSLPPSGSRSPLSQGGGSPAL